MRSSAYKNRFPSFQENLQVFAVIAALLYAWTILWLLWELPSWLQFLSIVEILPLFAYALATNFLESALVLGGLNLLCFFLPQGWFHSSFVSRGSLLIALGLGYLMFFISQFGKEAEYPIGLMAWSVVILIFILPFSLYLGKIPLVRNLAEIMADRLTVFLYLIVPLSVISLLFVLLRNVW